jgi:hypothetical protein
MKTARLIKRRWLHAIIASSVGLGLLVIGSGVDPASAAHTKQLKVTVGQARVVLSVPSTWHVSKTAPTPSCGCGGDYQPVCIVASGDYRNNPNNCELVVGGDIAFQRTDTPVPGWRLPKCGNWTTSYAADAHLGTRMADYRIFLDRCHDKKSEQWTSLTTPSVSIWHPMRWKTDDEAAATAAGSAKITGRRTAGRTSDIGYVRNVTVRSGHAYVTIDRVVPSLKGKVINRNHATYTYRLRTPSHLAQGDEPCSSYWPDCTAGQLRAQFRQGAHPAGGTKRLAGRLLRIDTSDIDPKQRVLSDPYLYKFSSTGDRGHCGC